MTIDHSGRFSEPVDPPAGHRGRTTAVRVPPAGCAPDRRARLDTLIRLCDAALWELDVPMKPAPGAVWVVRRTTVQLRRWPTSAEVLTVATWCSALGRVWAERRIDLDGGGGSCVRLATLWASVDLDNGRPTRLAPGLECSDVARRVTVGLSHAEPPAGSHRRAWPLRRSDIDVLGHVNNSVVWAAWEDSEAAALHRVDDAGCTLEAEYRAQLYLGPAELTGAPSGDQVWLGAPGERPAASVRRLPGPPGGPA
ncbi:MAG: thioesterase [Microthrixaceae bacterium]